jgi:predicted DNA-binding protein (UPF0251 family)
LSTYFNNLDISEWISQADAARLRGVSRQAIAKLVSTGRLETLIIGGRAFVRKKEILNFEALPSGRPKALRDDN